MIQERCSCILDFRPQILTLSQEEKFAELEFKNSLLERTIGKIDPNINKEIDSLIVYASKMH